MSEVTLQGCVVVRVDGALPCDRGTLQGYLAHKKTPTPRGSP